MRLYPTALQKYFDHPTCGVREESSRRSVRSTVRLFQDAYPDLELHQVSQRHVEEWLGNRLKNGVSDGTVQKNLQRLSSLFRWARRQGHIKENPAEDLKEILRLRPQAVRKHTWLDESQTQKILDSVEILTSLDLRDALVLRLGFTAGLRNNEIRTLPISALVKIGEQRISVKGKGKKLAEAWVPAVTAELLTRWLDLYERPKPSDPVVVRFRNLLDWETGIRTLVPQWGIGISQQAIGRIVKERSSVVGYPISPHDMRRSYAGMVHAKVGIEQTSQALRHSNLGTTQLYLENRQDSAYQAAKKAGLDL